ncbi:MAG: FAD-dependent monooxygenase [Gemmataceae bacterium]|nr:FAD-dependent monooxygenase [Gemmataceae bacterium]
MQATLGLDEAAARTWDAIAVGAGPAGALAAHELARRGVSVLLVDKCVFPRWKVCGCCVNGRALAALRSAGLGELAAQRGAVPLEGILLAAAGRRALVPLRGEVALSREALDAGLVNAAVGSGTSFLPETQATLGKAGACTRTVLLRQGERTVDVEARVVVAAPGLGGRFIPGETPRAQADSRIGAGVVADGPPEFYVPGRIFMATGHGGYVGLVRREDGRLNIAAAFDASFVKQEQGPGAAAMRVLQQAGFPAIADLESLAWRGTPTLTRRPAHVAAERVFVLGDAAGYVEPFTGEGIAWALGAGVALAPLALRAVRRWDSSLADAWSQRLRHTVTRRQRVCQVTATLLRRPSLLEGVVAVLAFAPGLASPLVHYVNS